MEELIDTVRACPAAIKSPWLGPEISFKWVVDAFGATMSVQDAVSLMNVLVKAVPFQVYMRNPSFRALNCFSKLHNLLDDCIAW